MTISREEYHVNPVTSVSKDEINRLVLQIQTHLNRIALSFAEVKGIGGNKPTLSNHLDMSGNDLQNVGKISFAKSALTPTVTKLATGNTTLSGNDAASFADVNTALDEQAKAIADIAKTLNGIIT